MPVVLIRLALLGLLLGGLGVHRAQAQCLDTNTLLDSVYAINLRSLNALRYHANDTVRGEMVGLQRPDRYTPLLLAKIFRRHLKQESIVGADSTRFDLGFRFYAAPVTRLAWQPGPHVRVAVVSQATTAYLVTLREDLSLIDFVTVDQIMPDGYLMDQKKGSCLARHTGIDAELTPAGRLSQTHWRKLVKCSTGQVQAQTNRKKYFQIQPDGRIVAQ